MRALIGFLFFVPVLAMGEQPVATPGPPAVPEKAPAAAISPELKAAIAGLKLPGIKIDLEEWCVDVDATICLREGLLELIACTKDTKEHESIIVVEAKPSHIHTALLLIRGKPGNPAMQKAVDAEGSRFIPIPPRGGNVDVFLVVKGADGKPSERPISDFISRNDRHDSTGTGSGAEETGEDEKFPTHTFLFAGSVLTENAGGPRTYLCDQSGNVISIATFGDEVLCLPEIHGSENGSLVWQAKTDSLPALGTKVTLRLRPQVKPPKPLPKPAEDPPKK